MRRAEYLFGMPTKNDVFFSAVSCKEDIIFGGHPKQIFGPSYFVRALDNLKLSHIYGHTLQHLCGSHGT